MTLPKAKMPTRRAFSERMREAGAVDREFIVMDADIGASTYANLFGAAYPQRYFNMGIAELCMVSAAAGAACEGRTVVVSSYGVFLTMRAVESMRSYVCYPNLNVKFLSSHGGLTAAVDGVSHQATEDIAFVSTLPNMKVLVPADPTAAAAAFDLALATPGPVFVRLMRDPFYDLYPPGEPFELGGSKVVRPGRDVTIAAYGDMVFQALEAAEELSGAGISAEVLDMYSLKPWDAAGLERSLDRTGALVVVENHQKRNGLGYELSNHLLKHRPVPFENLGLEDTFAESGDYYQVIEKYGISRKRIVATVRDLLTRKGACQWSRAQSSPAT
jgi:transketolase